MGMGGGAYVGASSTCPIALRMFVQVFRILDAKDGCVDGVLSMATAHKSGVDAR